MHRVLSGGHHTIFFFGNQRNLSIFQTLRKTFAFSVCTEFSQLSAIEIKHNLTKFLFAAK